MLDSLLNTAVVFPGQGSQYVGMLQELHETMPVVESIFSLASKKLGYDLLDLVCFGPREKLDSTEFTQPAMLVTGVAMWHALSEWYNVAPVVMAGHSLGEYTALVCSGLLSLEDALTLITKRAELMQKAVAGKETAMVAVLGLNSTEVNELCSLAMAQGSNSSVVEIANFNSPLQFVVAGDLNAVNIFQDLASKKGAKKLVKLAVSVPAHCSLMQPIAAEYLDFLDTIDLMNPHYPVIHNFNVSYATAKQARFALSQQLYNPVRWIETIETMETMGVNQIIECGPGSVLSGLNKRIVKSNIKHLSFNELILSTV